MESLHSGTYAVGVIVRIVTVMRSEKSPLCCRRCDLLFRAFLRAATLNQ